MLPTECFTEIASRGDSTSIANLSKVCKMTNTAMKDYIKNHQWFLTQLPVEVVDPTIVDRLQAIVPIPFSESLFYKEFPLTAYHVRILNNMLKKVDYDTLGVRVGDEGIKTDVMRILFEELTRLGYKVAKILKQKHKVFSDDTEIVLVSSDVTPSQARDTQEFYSEAYIISFVLNDTEYDPLYLKLLKCPVWIHYSNRFEIYDGKREFNLEARTCKGKVIRTSNLHIPLPPLVYKEFYRRPNSVNPGFRFDDLTYAEIGHALYSGVNNPESRHREGMRVYSVTKRDPPIKFVRGKPYPNPRLLPPLVAERTDIPSSDQDFWILIDPHAKPEDKPLILHTNPKETIELSSLLSVIYPLPRKKQVDLITLLSELDIVDTNIPMDLLLLTDDELISSGKSILLDEVKDKHNMSLFPRLLFIYDTLPITPETTKYIHSLAKEIIKLLKGLNSESKLSYIL